MNLWPAGGLAGGGPAAEQTEFGVGWGVSKIPGKSWDQYNLPHELRLQHSIPLTVGSPCCILRVWSGGAGRAGNGPCAARLLTLAGPTLDRVGEAPAPAAKPPLASPVLAHGTRAGRRVPGSLSSPGHGGSMPRRRADRKATGWLAEGTAGIVKNDDGAALSPPAP